MRRTTFRNASGLHHPQQRTTARDMALLGRALLRDHPQYYGIFATRTFRWSGNSYANHNRLMGAYRGMDGIKTGYTQPAGYNLVASASRNGRRLVGVVLGSRWAAVRNGLMASLLDQGFRTAPNTLAVSSAAVKRSKGGKQIAAGPAGTVKAKRTKAGKQVVASRSGGAAKAKRTKSAKVVVAARSKETAQMKRKTASKPVMASRSRQMAKATPRRSGSATSRITVQKKPGAAAPATIRVRRDAAGT